MADPTAGGQLRRDLSQRTGSLQKRWHYGNCRRRCSARKKLEQQKRNARSRGGRRSRARNGRVVLAIHRGSGLKGTEGPISPKYAAPSCSAGARATRAGILAYNLKLLGRPERGEAAPGRNDI